MILRIKVPSYQTIQSMSVKRGVLSLSSFVEEDGVEKDVVVVAVEEAGENKTHYYPEKRFERI